MTVQTVSKSLVAELLGQKRNQDAADAAERYLIQYPEDVGVTHALGTALYRIGNHVGALVAYRRRLELQPDSAIGHFSLGRAQLKTGDKTAARRSFERAKQLDPSMSAATKQLSALDEVDLGAGQGWTMPSTDWASDHHPSAVSAPPNSPGTAASRPAPQRRPGVSEAQERAKQGELGQGEVLFHGHRSLRSRPFSYLAALALAALTVRVESIGDKVGATLKAMDGTDHAEVDNIVSQIVDQAGTVFLLVAVAIAARATLASLMTSYHITTESIQVREGILWRRQNYYYLFQIDSIEQVIGPIDYLVRNATLRLTTERTVRKMIGLNTESTRPKILELSGLGTPAETDSLFHAIRKAATRQEVDMRGNLIR